MLYISISITLFALMAGMLLLAKTKKDGLGSFFKWISYLVIVIALLILICQCVRGGKRMMCRTKMCPPSENCMPGMMGGSCGHGGGMMMHHGCMDGQGNCMMMHHGCMMGYGKCEEEEMEMCKMGKDSMHCKGEMKHGCPYEDEKEVKTDSAKKK